MNPEDMLNEISQSRKDKFHFYEVPRVAKFLETESKTGRQWLVGEETGSYHLMGMDFS